MPIITATGLGLMGVNVDKNPLELDDNELTQAKNAISVTGRSTVRKRAGLLAFTTTATAGSVLGGVDLAVQDLSSSGVHFVYVGRGPTS